MSFLGWRRGQSSASSDAGIDEGVSVEPKLLHGTLRVTICKPEAPNDTTDPWSEIMQYFKEKAGFGVDLRDALGVDLEVGLGIAKFNTTVKWDVPFQFHCAHMVSNISITLGYGGYSIGTKEVPVENILNGQETETRFGKDGLEIPVKVQYLDVEEDDNWDRGIGSLEFSGLPNACFPQRKGCKVSLYQDAHVPDSFNPNITLAEGQPYQPKSCWEDVFDAINGAQHIIYITGWSVYTEISLISDSRRPGESGKTLGELLKKKANEEVQVLLLLWHDISALGSWGGMMATHCKETMKYFSGSKVRCVLCDNPAGITISHHQKTVVVDSELPGEEYQGRRQIVSFVGGIDLCDGRYDTPSHSLFRGFSGSKIQKGGPRQPWHDIHTRLEGPIAWDVLDNFVQRWRKQGKIKNNGKNIVLLKELGGIIIDRSKFPFNDHDHDIWCAQLLRSIDSKAAIGFPNAPEAATGAGLVSGKNKIIDRSIQDAYISAIRRAKNFIYIESQYFLGSSYAWNSDGINLKENNSWHLIPKELSLKIVSKIEARERFTVYVVVPMSPEGSQEGKPVPDILFNQKMTMEMMYKDVTEALKDIESVEDASNYLAFFCLGNREKMEGEYQPPKWSHHMIYVHSKMMIVDDEYIIIGSANINQRSMDGTRDTEIAFGGYQPHHLATTGHPARGQIYGFRMSLWYEHLGRSETCFNQPQDEVCIERVNKLAETNWDAYCGSTPVRDVPYHLLRYPINIEDGAIKELKGFEFIPGTKVSVLGKQSLLSRSALLPSFVRQWSNSLF